MKLYFFYSKTGTLFTIIEITQISIKIFIAIATNTTIHAIKIYENNIPFLLHA